MLAWWLTTQPVSPSKSIFPALGTLAIVATTRPATGSTRTTVFAANVVTHREPAPDASP